MVNANINMAVIVQAQYDLEPPTKPANDLATVCNQLSQFDTRHSAGFINIR